MYWSNGAQIIPPHDHGISEEITRNLQPWHLADTPAAAPAAAAATPASAVPESTVQPVPFDISHPRLSDPFVEVTDAYFAQAKRDYCWRGAENAQLKQADVPVTYTAMHGVGAPFTARALSEFGLPAYIPTLSQIEADPEFPTVAFPNPEEGKGALKLAMAAADEQGSALILANDPDADRLAVAEKVDGEWKPLNGNQIALLLADWAFCNYVQREQPTAAQLRKTCMIASTVSSGVLGAMAAREGFNFYPTLTGFKWMGNRAVQAVAEGERFLFAFEVEIGFLVGNQSYDKVQSKTHSTALCTSPKVVCSSAQSGGSGWMRHCYMSCLCVGWRTHGSDLLRDGSGTQARGQAQEPAQQTHGAIRSAHLHMLLRCEGACKARCLIVLLLLPSLRLCQSAMVSSPCPPPTSSATPPPAR